MKRLISIFSLPHVLIKIIRNIKQQQRFLKDNIHPLMLMARETNDGSLSEKDFDKINKYYGLAVPAILANAFCVLEGRKLSETERWISTCQGAATGLFDDFFDEKYLDDIDILKKIEISHEQHSGKSNEVLFDFFYRKMLELSDNPDLIKDCSLAIYKDQVKSKSQQDSNLSLEQTWEITLSKGGNSVLFYRSAIDPPASSREKDILYTLGGLMQLSNDVFDIYKDREAGIKTLPMFYTDMGELEHFFTEKMLQAYQDIYSLTKNKKCARQFLSILSISIFSRSYVCLAQLQQLQKTSGNIFQLSLYNRNQLICDMDTKKNIMRSAAYHVKYFV
ncbi:MAG: hypothetical protein ABIY51_02405 [Ferruginibacter sp.]